MFKYFFILAFIVGMMGSSVIAATPTPAPCEPSSLECSATVKCVCEYGGNGQQHIRRVSCPDKDLPSGFEVSDNVDGALEVDCGADVEAQCDALDISCKKQERPNCLVTLPIEVECETPED